MRFGTFVGAVDTLREARCFEHQDWLIALCTDKKGTAMEGINYVVNDKGEKTAVLIDLEKYGELWEDFYDSLIAALRSEEPRESLDAVKERLKRQGKLNG